MQISIWLSLAALLNIFGGRIDRAVNFAVNLWHYNLGVMLGMLNLSVTLLIIYDWQRDNLRKLQIRIWEQNGIAVFK